MLVLMYCVILNNNNNNNDVPGLGCFLPDNSGILVAVVPFHVYIHRCINGNDTYLSISLLF